MPFSEGDPTVSTSYIGYDTILNTHAYCASLMYRKLKYKLQIYACHVELAS